jgi:Tfp pilus assembly protein PilV
MVAMLVLAIGLLGLAGITVVVLRSNTLSQQISEATTISADLMDTIKRQSLTSLQDCVAANSYGSSHAVPTSGCEILTESGVSPLGNNYLPAYTRDSAGCVVSGATVLQSGSTAVTFDNVASNFAVFSDSWGTSANLCSLTSTTLAPHSYIRYYRTFLPTGGSATDRTIVVVVLWKDRFGRWRNVHLSTTRTN